MRYKVTLERVNFRSNFVGTTDSDYSQGAVKASSALASAPLKSEIASWAAARFLYKSASSWDL